MYLDSAVKYEETGQVLCLQGAATVQLLDVCTVIIGNYNIIAVFSNFSEFNLELRKKKSVCNSF